MSKIYVVKKGDYLERIATEQLGDGARWAEIAHINNLQSPYRITVNQVLELPVNDSEITTVLTTEQKRAAQQTGAAMANGERKAATSPAGILILVTIAAALFWKS